MGIRYECKHCGTNIGEIGFEHYGSVQNSLTNWTDEEKNEMITHQNGNMNINTVCENCQEELQSNPNYYEYGHYVQ